jgi:hypothetical protein
MQFVDNGQMRQDAVTTGGICPSRQGLAGFIHAQKKRWDGKTISHNSILHCPSSLTAARSRTSYEGLPYQAKPRS